MPGFDAIGRLALGQGADQTATISVLVADGGAYAITGVAAAFGSNEAAAAGSFAVTGIAVTLADKLLAAAGSYSFTGNAVTFGTGEPAVAGSYALGGKAVTFAGAEPAAAGAYVLAGKTAVFAGALPPVSGSYSVTGYGAIDLIVMPVGAGSYGLTPGPYVLTRTGGDFDQVYGGIGHYLEQLEQAKQLAKITRKIPAPIVHAIAPRLRPVPAPPAVPAQPAGSLEAIAPQRLAAGQAERLRISQRRRQEAEILLLAS
jgi:hypothetical protein